jgi:HlyD family secretion protein
MSRNMRLIAGILKKVVGLLILLGGAGALVWYFFLRDGDEKKVEFTFGEVERGDVEETVSCTGTLSAVGTVLVGSQVSGTIEKLYVDFNDTVKKGQVLIKLDRSLLNAEVLSANATLLKNQAELAQAEAEFERSKKLFEKGFLSESDYILAETSLQTARAAIQSSKATLKRAKTNQKYAVIKSPIDGTVIERNVDEGQTIASSFSTPQLFVIAEDMSRMQIEASVDESDIGLIKQGMEVRFTVQAYPDDEFTGTVRQVRLKPVTVSNVVTYTVVVDAPNDSGRLMPGMTATVDFIIDSRQQVLTVPNSALSFKPTAEMLKGSAVSGKAAKDTGKKAHAGLSKGEPGSAGKSLKSGKGGGKSLHGKACVYLKAGEGLVSPVCFTPGLTDGSVTEVLGDSPLKEGTSIVTGTTEVEEEEGAKMRLPLPGMGKGPPR